MSLPISFLFAGLPNGTAYCFESFQRFALDIANGMSGTIEGGLFNMSEAEPDPDQRDRPWLRLVGGFPDRWYVYAGGSWVWPNSRQAGGERIWWDGTESDLWSYDGGDGTDPSSSSPTSTTGAMWQRDTTWDAKFPVQAGTLPNGTVLTIGATGGQDEQVIPDHDHTVGRMESDSGNNADDGFFLTGSSDNAGNARGISGDKNTNEQKSLSDCSGDYLVSSTINDIDDLPKIATVPPYKVAFWAKRTARVYYVPQ